MKHNIFKSFALCMSVLILLSVVPCFSVYADSNTYAGFTYKQNGKEAVITGYNGSLKEITIPEKIGNLTVTEIAEDAFYDSSFDLINLAGTLKKISKDAFYKCYVETVNVKDIASWCKIEFENEYANPCAASAKASLCIDGVEIKSLYIPEGVTKINSFAFYNNRDIEKVFIPQSVKSIGEMAFRGAYYIEEVYCVSTGKNWETMTSKAPVFITDDAEIRLINPDETPIHGLTYREENGEIIITGYEGNLFRLEIPEKINGKPVVKIDSYAFDYNNKIAEVILPDTLKEIFPGAFLECEYLTKVNIPKNVQVLHEGVFENCESLRDIEFPKNLKEIGIHAFSGCDSITKVEIPEGTESLLGHAFGDCYNLDEIKLHDNIKVFSGAAFYNTAYYNDESNWISGALYIGNYLCFVNENAKGKFVVNEGTRIIPDQAFDGNLGITEIVLPDSVTTIGDAAFSGCENLKKINLPEGITEIPYRAFEDCYSLEKIELPSTVTRIGESAFNVCRSLKEINIPQGVTEIGRNAFGVCAFESITLPQGVTRIEDDTFRYCKNLKEIKFGDNIQYITAGAFTETPLYVDDNWQETEFYLDYCFLFYDHTSAKEYTVKDGTRVMGDNAFRNFYDLEVLNIPESVEYICDSVFDGPIDLKKINFGGSELQWNAMIQSADTGLEKSVTVNFAEESRYILGDANLDGKLNVRDATAVQKHMAKLQLLEGKALELADFNSDGKINIKDATAIQKHIAGIK